MDVCCRCKCGTLMDVNYTGEAVSCPSCGSIVLTDNDPRVTPDYDMTAGGHLRVIGGDALDDLISGMDEGRMDRLMAYFAGLAD